ncbi:MAG: FAD:protein FMN transferase [Clostridia bacterium]|nr:FAD:protein FMN transferase [Clostridia bacterium]
MKRLFCLILCLALCGCAASANAQRYTASFQDVFDTASQIVIYADDQGEANRIAQLVYSELLRYHKLFDQYNDWTGVTGVYEVNRDAASRPVKVEQELFDLLVFSKSMYEKTNGRTNIAMGNVLRLWHQAREHGLENPSTARLPDMAALQEAARHTDPSGILLDSEKTTVAFADPQLKLDLGAIAKGYAVERVADLLESEGVSGVLLSIGGNVRTIGLRPDGTAFPVGVQNPDLSAEPQHIAVAGLDNTSLVTSGSYQRFYTVDGRQYHHIIDPDTLMPADHIWAVSVVAEDSGLADALSTALFTLSLEDGMALLETVPEAEALWVLKDGRIEMTEGMRELVSK